MLKEYKSLLHYIKPYRMWYAAGILGLFVTNGFQLLIPQFVRQVINTITLTSSFRLEDIRNIILYMLGTTVIIALGRFSWRYFIGTTSRRIETLIRRDFFAHLMTLDGTFYQQNSIGDLMARSTNDMQTIRMATGMAFVAAFDGIFLTVSILIIMFSQTPRLAAYIILPLPFMTILILFFGRLISPIFKSVQEGFANLSDHSQETFSGIRIIKSFVKEQYFLKRFGVLNDEYRTQNMKLVMLHGMFFPIILFLSGLTTTLLLFFGGRQVIEGEIMIGDFVSTLSYLQMMIWPMVGAGFTISLIQRGATSLGRINRIMEYRSNITNNSSACPLLNGNISVEGLSLSIDNRQILHNISFHASQHSLLGITGPVGSGKTTLLNCLLRLSDWDEGSICIDGHDVRDIDLYHLRKCFGYVPQRPFLFSATLRDNITFGTEGLSDKEFDELIHITSLNQDFKLFSHGWETIVGEKGVTISGGQKQRSSLARALATKPSILLLDDPLSAVDVHTEERILASFLKQIQGKTSIIVSHRVSTLKHCDNIIVMENGKISQQGNPDTLKNQEGYYHRIFEIQRSGDTQAPSEIEQH